jgi:hypothetical protein
MSLVSVLTHDQIPAVARVHALKLLPDVRVINLGFERRIDDERTDFGFVAKATKSKLVEPQSAPNERTFIVSHEYDLHGENRGPHVFAHVMDFTDVFSTCPQLCYIESAMGLPPDVTRSTFLEEVVCSLPRDSRSGFLGVVDRGVPEIRLQFGVYVLEVQELLKAIGLRPSNELKVALIDLEKNGTSRLNLQLTILDHKVARADIELGITKWESRPPERWFNWLERHVGKQSASSVRSQTESWWGYSKGVARWTHLKVDMQLLRVKNYLWLEEQ